MNKEINRRVDMDLRLSLLRWFLLIALLLLGGTVFTFQVFRFDRYLQLAVQNRLRTLQIPSQRGRLFDFNGAPLALNVRTFDIKGYPLYLRREGVLRKLEQLLKRHGIPLTEGQLAEAVDRQYWAPYRAVTVVPNLTLAQVADLVTDPEFSPHLFPYPVWRRVYPAGPLAAHVVGYVGEISSEELDVRKEQGYRGGDIVGKMGIEAVYEERLRGRNGEEAIEVDARGRRLRRLDYRSQEAGEDITLTLDLGAQRLAAEMMETDRGAVVALDVETGAVRVLYSSPSFDANPLSWGMAPGEWRQLLEASERPMMNRAIAGVYPPASTFKVVVALAALGEKVATPQTTTFCPGYFRLGDRVFRCWRRSGHGSENLVAALRDSCDVWFYQIGLKIGVDNLMAWSSLLGMGHPTGIDLLGEVAGNLAGPEWKKARFRESWYPGDTVNYSIGQGFLLATPLQMAVVYAAVANGGYLVTPHLNAASLPKPLDLHIPREILTPVAKGLETVVKTGTGRQAGAFGVSLAGKTGTAQNAHGPDHAWFVGYAPHNAPRYVACVLVEAGEHGSSKAAPIAGRLLGYLVDHEAEAQR